MNQTAFAFIKAREGCKLTAYRDSGGVWTVGYGATGPDIVEGTVWTQQKADTDLATRVGHIGNIVATKTATAYLSDQQTAALISFAYNVGLGAFGGSTLLKYVIARNWIAAAKQFIAWDKDGGNEVQGLLKRRFYEGAMFLEGC
jgi:lysozyme